MSKMALSAAVIVLSALAACNSASQKTAQPEPAAKPEVHAAQVEATVSKERAQALETKGNCFACHKAEATVVGPSWKDIGAKYKGDAKAVATLATHIKAGGSFGWRMGNMPPRGGSTLADAEVESLARFIAVMK